jgi:anti-sigma factor RsiW
MTTIPPRDSDIQAYVDGRLDDEARRTVDAYLAARPELAAEIAAWQADAQQLRAALSGPLPPNPALDPAAIRRRLRARARRRLAIAAALLLATGLGGLGGWQLRGLAAPAPAYMQDALQAHRMFALERLLPADLVARRPGELQDWLDRRFAGAPRLPDLTAAGYRPLSARLLSTDQGPAAMVLYRDAEGRSISFYIRPPGPQHRMLPRGARRDGDLLARYWSGGGYNYAVVSRAEGEDAQVARKAAGSSI